MKKDKIKWGIIGTGRIANEFASDLPFTKSGVLAGVASRAMSSAQAFAEKHKINKAYDSYEALCKDSEIDAIYVATPHVFHFENSQMAMSHGKAVLCEKPVTTNLSDWQKLSQYALEHKILLMEGMWTYFLPVIQKAKEWIAEGRIGELKKIKADFGYPVPFDPAGRMYNPDLGGGALLDMGIYPLAMAWLFTQQQPKKFHSHILLAETGVDQDVSILMDFGDVVAELATSFTTKLPNTLFICGTEGYIEIPDFWHARKATLHKIDVIEEVFEDERLGGGFEFEAEYVNQLLLNDIYLPETVSHETSTVLQRWMEMILRSVDQ